MSDDLLKAILSASGPPSRIEFMNYEILFRLVLLFVQIAGGSGCRATELGPAAHRILVDGIGSDVARRMQLELARLLPLWWRVEVTNGYR